jgi:RNA polymerase sigma-70 factor (ECF subfamily)
MGNAEVVVKSAEEVPVGGADSALLESFLRHGDEAAFGALVQRYGPLVFGVCRRVLQHQQDAEDAFQATFLVLARKAGSISKRECVGSWLYGVAYRIARQAKAKMARLPIYNANLPEVPTVDGLPELVWRDLRPVLDEEVSRLARKYREPFLLCYFEGKTNEQAARQLGCPLGTVLSRLARARDRLRSRLKRRGIALSVAMLATLLAEETASAAVPAALARKAVKAAAVCRGQGGMFPPTVSATVAMFAEGFLTAQRRTKLQQTVLGVVGTAMGLAVIGILVFAVISAGTGHRDRPGGSPSNTLLAADAGDEQKIRGAWIATRVEVGGNLMKDKGSRIEFNNDSKKWDLDCKIQFEGVPEHKFQVTAQYTIDPTQAPRAVDLKLPNGVMLGIYRFENETLHLCFDAGGKERPKEFATKPQTAMFYYVLKREPGQ